MVSSSNLTALYITVPGYFAVLSGCAALAYFRMQQLKHDSVQDALNSHYLGGRSFGGLVTAGTLFASLFSGYTVIGIPNEAFRNGFGTFWWVPTILCVAAGCFGTNVRLRRLMYTRNHHTPCDFITDRFQSQVTRYAVLTLQILPSVIYLAAQVNAIKVTFNAIFDLEKDNPWPVVIIMGIILVFEWAGGLNSVALTDCVQAFVMMLSFIIITFIIKAEWGGWSSLDPVDFPKPQFFQTMSRGAQWKFAQNSFVNFSFFTLPHLLQRTYAAKNLNAMKAGFCIMAVGT